MSNILVINASGQETRVALIEQGTISEYYLERKNEKGIVGNVYKGKVVRVLPGMQAAFVDIGLDKAAFLYVADIVADPNFPGFSEEIEIQAGATEGDPLDIEDIAEPAENGTPTPPVGSAALEAASATLTPQSVPPVEPAPFGDASPPPPPAEAAQSSEPAGTGSPEKAVPAVGEPNILPESALANGAAAEASAIHKGAAESPAGEQTEPHQDEPILDLSPEEALDEGEDEGEGEGDDEDEDEDEGDAAHAAAEAAIAAEGSSEGPATAASASTEAGGIASTGAAPSGAKEGKIGVPP